MISIFIVCEPVIDIGIVQLSFVMAVDIDVKRLNYYPSFGLINKIAPALAQ